jgi:thiosulfate/3-mercaptopyruvate sulfurtransferase
MTEAVYTGSSVPIVSTDWLSERLGDDKVVPVDVRSPHFFVQAHIPGAVNLPVFFLQGQGGGPPAGDDLAARLGRLGITRDTHVVACDEGGVPSAAVLYWVLRYFGHPRVSVLDGGITLWRHEGRDWEYSVQNYLPALYEIGAANSAVYAQREDVLAALEDPNIRLVDVRSPAEYLGLQVTTRRSGHIPGAINFEWSNTLSAGSDGLPVLRAETEIRDALASAGVTADTDVIVYCQSGGRSSHTFLVLESLGFRNVRNYAASWQEWGNRPDTPIESG